MYALNFIDHVHEVFEHDIPRFIHVGKRFIHVRSLNVGNIFSQC